MAAPYSGNSIVRGRYDIVKYFIVLLFSSSLLGGIPGGWRTLPQHLDARI
jgi:hypothetical protein